ncbi:Wzz/FepE/Etk N-terminal domain-containing protein [Adlercreutzia sp. ZJ242]|uniref:Wzz/FepE/Etk N-terminal domain-containing protein n=1 Tax=Adlercreutzia sp. ZJ242 TaxID=2709409 RepID=UPI0013E9FD6D|nr:Wzz/FepE/Etk N-terminal domain-containing protein [Adlercreutzia sp. ZJ242]
MTLLDLLKLMKRNWKIMVALPVICAVLCAGVLLVMPKTYSATATVAVSAEPGGIGGVAEGVASEVAGQTGLEVTAKANTAAKTVSITAEGGDSSACVSAANDAAEKTKTKSAALYSGAAVQVSKASAASDISPSLPKYVAVALLAGLFVAICAIVVIDMFRAPIHSAEEAEEIAGAPVLGYADAPDGGKRLLANVSFAAGADARMVCVVPVGPADSAARTSEELALAAAAAPQQSAAKIRFESTSSLTAGVDAAYAARTADATVVVVREWLDSAPALVETMRELKLAGVEPAGLALVSEAKPVRAEKAAARAEKAGRHASPER